VVGGRRYPPIAGGSSSAIALVVGDLLGPQGRVIGETVMSAMNKIIEPCVREVEELKAMDAFWRFKAGDRRSDYAGRMLGYGYLIQRFGWEFLEQQLTRQAIWMVRKEFDRVGIRPEEIEFDQPAAFLDEVARTGDPGLAPKAIQILDDEFPLEEEEDEEVEEDG